MNVKDFLYEENGFLIYRNLKGQFEKVPKNKFKDGEIVTTTDKHFSRKNITKVVDPTYVEGRGWVYGENYINEQGNGGGCGYSFNEDLFDKITDPKFKLIAERIKLKKEIEKLSLDLKNKVNNLQKLEFAMDISIPFYKEATNSCKKCGTLFKGFDGGDPNKDLCTNCLSL